jgi:glucokinase
MNYYAGIDLGGTKIYSVILDESGKILAREKVKTGSTDNQNDVIQRISDCYRKALKTSGIADDQIKAIGMAVPSPVNVDRGILIHAPNLGWKNIPLASIMHRETGKPFFIDNDVNLGVYGEYSFNKNIKGENIYGMFVGTGIGGGYIRNGQIIRGKNHTAGEIGHMIVKTGGPHCNCGRNGCLEAIAGKLGIIANIRKKVDKEGKTTLLSTISPEWRKNIGSSALKKCWDAGDLPVMKAIRKSAVTIGIAAANLINAVGIDTLILGGGVIEELGDVMIPLIRQSMTEYSIGNGAEGIEVVQSHLGDDAVALGAGWFASRPENRRYLITQ